MTPQVTPDQINRLSADQRTLLQRIEAERAINEKQSAALREMEKHMMELERQIKQLGDQVTRLQQQQSRTEALSSRNATQSSIRTRHGMTMAMDDQA